MITKGDIVEFILDKCCNQSVWYFDDANNLDETLEQTNSIISMHESIGGEGDGAPMSEIFLVESKDH